MKFGVGVAARARTKILAKFPVDGIDGKTKIPGLRHTLRQIGRPIPPRHARLCPVRTTDADCPQRRAPPRRLPWPNGPRQQHARLHRGGDAARIDTTHDATRRNFELVRYPIHPATSLSCTASWIRFRARDSNRPPSVASRIVADSNKRVRGHVDKRIVPGFRIRSSRNQDEGSEGRSLQPIPVRRHAAANFRATRKQAHAFATEFGPPDAASSERTRTGARRRRRTAHRRYGVLARRQRHAADDLCAHAGVRRPARSRPTDPATQAVR